MAKNIVICCDGTGNQVTVKENSNIVHLFACLEKSENQNCFYSQGLGTSSPLWVERNRSKFWFKLKAKAFGNSLKLNVLNAYKFIMDHYDEGDKIFLFGFSRGAYTVRVVAGLIRMFGIIQKGNYAHLEQLFDLYENYKSKKKSKKEGKTNEWKVSDDVKIAARIKSSFSKGGKIAFMGIWDSVSSIGNIFFPNTNLPYTYDLKYIKTVRHAVSIDEKRKNFYFQKVRPDTHKDLKEVFFSGDHSDIGGSHSKEGLSKLTLEWMLGEASLFGLKLEKSKVDKYVFGVGEKFQGPNHIQDIHDLHKGIFKVFPAKYREIPDGSLIHISVSNKLMEDQNYNPSNLTNLSKMEIVNNQEIHYER